MEVQFRLTNPRSEKTLLVPEHPIIRFNVIEELLNQWDQGMPKSDAIKKVSRLFSLEMKSAGSVIKLMQKPNGKLNVRTVQAGKREVRLAVGQITTIFARAQELSLERVYYLPHVNYHNLLRVLVIEEGLVRIDGDRVVYVPIPITNTNKHDITLSPHLILGHLQEVKMVYAATTEPVHTQTA